MPRATWSGAVDFAGFPVNVSFFGRIASSKSGGFTMIAPDGGKASQRYVDSKGEVFGTMGDCRKGIEVAPDMFVILTPEQLDLIKDAEKTGLAEPEQFTPFDDDLRRKIELATTYNVAPNGKVPGSEKSVSQLWNGLLTAGAAYVTKIVMRVGSGDKIVVLYADEDGLRAAAIPFHDEVVVDYWKPERDERAGKTFAAMIETLAEGDERYKVVPFDHQALASEANARRERAIAAAVEGKEIEVPEKAVEQQAGAPDLMAAMEASLANVKRQSKGGKKAPKREKVAA